MLTKIHHAVIDGISGAEIMGLNITVMSSLGSVDVGIVADRDQMPDVHRLIDCSGTGWRSCCPVGVAGR